MKSMKTKTILIKYYILTHIDFEKCVISQIGSYRTLLGVLMCRFREYAKERKELGWSEREAFSTFCGALPSYFSVDFETYKQRELLKKWRVPVSGYREDEIADLFYNTIYKTLIRWEDVSWEN